MYGNLDKNDENGNQTSQHEFSSQGDDSIINNDLRSLKSLIWTRELEHYTGYTEEELGICVEKMWTIHCAAPTRKLCAIYTKYSKSDHAFVATTFRPCDKSLIGSLDLAIRIGGR